MKNKAITSRDEDFAQWYTDVVKAAKLADYSGTKGCIVFEPNGFALWEKMQSVLDRMFKETGHVNVCMPMLIPESLLKKEGELIEGFAPECAWVTMGGNKNLEERFAIRPTSETLFSDYYKDKVKSYRDLPKLYNQWCSVMRWEKETRPFLRTREFLWQEGHTVHESSREAIEETERMLHVYERFFKEYLAIPAITGIKTEKEKFAGAETTYTVESLMYNGVTLQSATSHYFGQKFSKAYDIKFLNRENQLEYAYQTSWGASTRMIGGLIMVHSDDFGLVLPPKIAPKQVVIVPIGTDEKVMNLSDEICQKLNSNGVVAFVDKTERSPGFKFAEHEVCGIPVRVEVGMRDLEQDLITLARRDTRAKVTITANGDIVGEVKALLTDIQNNLYNTALERRNKLTFKAKTLDELDKIMSRQPGFVYAPWCGSTECEMKVKEVKGTKSRCITAEHVCSDDKCLVCGKKAKHIVVWGIQY